MTAFPNDSKTDAVRKFDIRRVQNGEQHREIDLVAVEEPLSIGIVYSFKDSVRSSDLAVTMRTPGADRELALGLLLGEGVVASASDVVDVRRPGAAPNEIAVELAPGVDVETWRLSRHQFVSSACGVCGKQSAEAVRSRCSGPVVSDIRVPESTIVGLPDALRAYQAGFGQTGGLHAAALFDVDGAIVRAYEDVGRHNALDKVIGASIDTLPLHQFGVFLSSRGSFELVQKCAMARCPILATVGGPSSLAVEAAREFGITLVGFVRDRRFNVYSGEWRINS